MDAKGSKDRIELRSDFVDKRAGPTKPLLTAKSMPKAHKSVYRETPGTMSTHFESAEGRLSICAFLISVLKAQLFEQGQDFFCRLPNKKKDRE